MKKSTKIILIIIICVWMLFFITDYILVKKQKEPIFCIGIGNYINDGGTQLYFGLGYKVYSYYKLYDVEISEDLIGGTVLYKYLCPIWVSDEKAWENVSERAIEYSKEWWANYFEANPPHKKEDEPGFTELFVKYYGEEQAEALYQKISQEQQEKGTNDIVFTKTQKEQISIVINFLDRNIITSDEKEIFKDWLRGINFEDLDDKELENQITSL